AIALVLGSMAALALNRSSSRFKGLMVAFLISPLIVPRVVTAVGLFYLFAQLGIVGTTLGLVLGHAVIALPFVVITMSAGMKSYDTRLDQAAATLGATPLKTALYVMLPILKGSVLAAFLFAFIISFDDLSIALFTSGGLVSTLPKQMWDDMTLQLNPTISAASVVVTLLTLALLACAARATRNVTRLTNQPAN
ncbi:MAG: ABC transporter permease, partial [Pollutimonas bauzanensis]